MHLSNHTLLTLEFDKIRHHISERCASPIAREEIAKLTPLSDPIQIEQRLRPILECASLISFDSPISIHHLPDIRRILISSAPEGATLSVADLLQVTEILINSRLLYTYLDSRRTKYPALWQIVSPLTAFPNIEKNLELALDPVTATLKDSASAELRKIRRTIENTRTRIREQVELILSKLPDNVIQDRLVTVRGDRFVIPIRENQKRKLEGLVHDQSSSGATLFVEPMATVGLNNDLRQAEMAEQREIKRILTQLTAQIGPISGTLRDNLDILCQFDAIYAKASFARDLNATEPLFNTEGRIHLRNARHPLLVYRLRTEGLAQDIVPLSLTLGTDHHTLILTGPNAGGKTVSLKTVGLLALMAQAGLPIPADEKSELPFFSGIFADIGDAQSIENDLSTFSSHMRNLIDIEKNADGNALILLDEIGASTDPDEGSALAIALLNSFNDRGCCTIATTHHGALKAIAHSTPGMVNGSMAFDADTLRPTFHLRTGIPGSSYAFEIAERLGLNPALISHARDLVGSDVRHVESLILDLDEAYGLHLEALEKAQKDQAELDALKADFEERLKEVEQRERNLTQNAKTEAKRIIGDAKALVERTVREIRESQANRETIKEAHKTIEKEQIKLAKPAPQPKQPATTPSTESNLQPGDLVFSRTFEREGTLITAPNAGRVMVQMDNLKMELNVSDLDLRQRPTPVEEKRRFPNRISPKNPDVPLELDLHGHTFEQAVDKLDQYLSDAILSHLSQVRINHGKGTGVLRRKVGAHLKKHPSVKNIYSATPEQGDWGVTIVDFF